jgi:uncharacterized protein YeeX (DUF496 family)
VVRLVASKDSLKVTINIKQARLRKNHKLTTHWVNLLVYNRALKEVEQIVKSMAMSTLENIQGTMVF